jgi:putative ABC transport system substrate-binding protein
MGGCKTFATAKRVLGFAFAAALVLGEGIDARAQTPKKTARIGFVGQAKGTNLTEPSVIAFRQRLRDLGWIEGENLVVEWRFAEGAEERVRDFISDLVARKVDVLVATGGNPVRIARKATRTIPIVMTEHANPVGEGLIASLARPGGNITGMTSVRRELDGKRMELFKEVIPKLSHVGVLWQATRTTFAVDIAHVEPIAKRFGIALQSLGARNIEEIDQIFQSVPKGQTAGVLVVQSQLINSNKERIAEIAAKNRVPTIYPDRRYAFAGGFMSYGANTEEVYAQAAEVVIKILKGASPAELPVEQPNKFEWVINLKTAQQIGIKIPEDVLRWANVVIK